MLLTATIYWVGDVGSGRLAIVPRPRGGDWLLDELAALRTAGIDVLVSMLTAPEREELALQDEAFAAQAQGIEFFSLPVEDRSVPHDREAADSILAALSARLAAGRCVAVHCRQSIGQASLVAAALLVRQGVAADDAWRQVERARGRPVPDTDEQRRWMAPSG